ncbi:MAG: quinate 5-dehydrogenase [Clostridia bacterium]
MSPSRSVVSVSLGSKTRDHEAVLMLAGEPVNVHRRGVDGDLAEAGRLIGELDGQVDAIGLGGIDIALVVGEDRYPIHDALALASRASRTPVVDGFGVKAAYEPEVIRRLAGAGILRPGSRVLMASAMDRYPMARALVDVGLEPIFGDLMFASRIDYPIRTIAELAELARKILPEFTRLPFTMLYPTGAEQEAESDPRFQHYFDDADVLAGDFHLLRRYLPERIDGKVVVTTTTTAADVDLLKRRGASLLVTTTPRLAGRTFGTNVVEAALVARGGATYPDPAFSRLVMDSGLEPDIVRLGVDVDGGR